MSELTTLQPLEVDRLSTEEVLVAFNQLTAGLTCPKAAGLIEQPGLLTLPEMYAQYRVAAWDEQGVTEKQIVKLRTMHHLTAEGHLFENRLHEISRSGEADIPQKMLSAWRVRNRLLRKLSVDELVPVVYNVYGLHNLSSTPSPYPELMQMRLIGPARPVLADEIETEGDNSHDLYNKALEKLAAEAGIVDRREMHLMLGRLYTPAMFSPATARGTRQLSSVEAFVSWGQGILDFADVGKLPPLQRNCAMGRIALTTLKHVVRCTDSV